MKCAFSRSDFLYGDKWKELFTDREIRDVIDGKFARLALRHLEATPEQLAKYRLSHVDSPFPFPHTDTTVHYDRFFAASREGIHVDLAAEIRNRRNRKNAEKVWDCAASSLDSYFQSLAIAAGNEGLFRWNLSDSWDSISSSEPNNVTKRNCTDCNWMYDRS